MVDNMLDSLPDRMQEDMPDRMPGETRGFLGKIICWCFVEFDLILCILIYKCHGEDQSK